DEHSGHPLRAQRRPVPRSIGKSHPYAADETPADTPPRAETRSLGHTLPLSLDHRGADALSRFQMNLRSPSAHSRAGVSIRGTRQPRLFLYSSPINPYRTPEGLVGASLAMSAASSLCAFA